MFSNLEVKPGTYQDVLLHKDFLRSGEKRTLSHWHGYSSTPLPNSIVLYQMLCSLSKLQSKDVAKQIATLIGGRIALDTRIAYDLSSLEAKITHKMPDGTSFSKTVKVPHFYAINIEGASAFTQLCLNHDDFAERREAATPLLEALFGSEHAYLPSVLEALSGRKNLVYLYVPLDENRKASGTVQFSFLPESSDSVKISLGPEVQAPALRVQKWDDRS
jgi:hypothetical protein